MSDYRVNIHHDDRSFHDRTERMFRDMQRQMEDDMRRMQMGGDMSTRMPSWSSWNADEELNRMSRNFYKLKPRKTHVSTLQSSRDEFGSRENLDDVTGGKSLYIENPQTSSRTFNMSFDVRDYDPKDISVKVKDDTLMVEARHVEEKDGSKSVKEFNRKFKIPSDVDPEKLTSTLSSDKILTIQAFAPPKYEAVTHKSEPIKVTIVEPDGSIRCTPVKQAQVASSQQSHSSPVSFSSTTVFKPMPPDVVIFSTTEDGKRKMDLTIEIGKEYLPNEVSVKLQGKYLKIEAAHHVKEPGKTFKFSFEKEFELVENVDADSLRASVKDDNKMSITGFVKG